MPSEHGYGVVHAPVFETNVNPAGVGSVTVTPVASDGPAFVTVTAYVSNVSGEILDSVKEQRQSLPKNKIK